APPALFGWTENCGVPFHSGWSNCGFHCSSNQRAPNEFDIAVRKAMFSPQPALPRRQTPVTTLEREGILAAASLMKAQVGASGIFRPALSSRSLRYMTK